MADQKVKITELAQAVSINLADVIVLSQTDRHTRRTTLEALVSLFAEVAGSLSGEEIAGLLDTFLGGPEWRAGSSDPLAGAPALQSYVVATTPGSNTVTLDFSADTTKIYLSFRNGQLDTGVTRSGSVYTFPGPAFVEGESVTILAYPNT